jgi:hypothetical protein
VRIDEQVVPDRLYFLDAAAVMAAIAKVSISHHGGSCGEDGYRVRLAQRAGTEGLHTIAATLCHEDGGPREIGHIIVLNGQSGFRFGRLNVSPMAV